MPGLCVRESPAHGDTDTWVCSTALSERGRESLGRLAGGRAGAFQAPLFEVLRGEARPLWRRQVRHIVRPPGQLCPELVPGDHKLLATDLPIPPLHAPPARAPVEVLRRYRRVPEGHLPQMLYVGCGEAQKGGCQRKTHGLVVHNWEWDTHRVAGHAGDSGSSRASACGPRGMECRVRGAACTRRRMGPSWSVRCTTPGQPRPVPWA